MNAEFVWNVWRRILREETLHRPLLERLLERRGHDVEAFATQFLHATGWHDNGPYTYRTSARVLEYLADGIGVPDAELQDVAAFEQATCALLQRLAGPELPAPAPGEVRQDDERQRFSHSRRGLLVTTRFDPRPWLADPESVGRSPLERDPVVFLRYLRSSADEPGLLVLGERSRHTYEAFDVPRSVREVAQRVQAEPDAVVRLVQRLLALGVLEPRLEAGP
jgi:hypothetical protein